MTCPEWSQFNKDLWAALVHLSSGEAAAKVDHSGQGEGLVAYIRVWNWFNANANVQKYERRMKVLSPDRRKTAAAVADAVERWGNRLSLIQEGGSNFICGEGWKVSLLRKILPEGLDKEVALRSSELGDSCEETRAFIMKSAVQERVHHSTDMDTSELSGWYTGGDAISGGYSGIEEVQEYTKLLRRIQPMGLSSYAVWR